MQISTLYKKHIIRRALGKATAHFADQETEFEDMKEKRRIALEEELKPKQAHTRRRLVAVFNRPLFLILWHGFTIVGT